MSKRVEKNHPIEHQVELFVMMIVAAAVRGSQLKNSKTCKADDEQYKYYMEQARKRLTLLLRPWDAEDPND